MRGIAPNSTLSQVWRKVANVLRTSDRLGAIDSFRQWQPGDGRSGTEPPQGSFVVEVFPYVEGQQWESPSSHTVHLVIAVAMAFDSKDADDYLNVFMAVVQSVYPPAQADRLALEQSLRDLGCTTGQPMIQWPQPDLAEVIGTGRMQLAGQIRYEVRLQLDS